MIGEETTVIELIAPPVEDQWCWVCGARRGRAERDEQWIVDRDGDGPRGRVTEAPWSRRHVACQPVGLFLIEKISGETVEGLTVAEVDTVIRDAAVPMTALAVEYTGGKPWRWVTDSDRGRLRLALESVRRARDPQPHPNGRCGACGVGRSTEWSRVVNLNFLDRTPAYTCAVCTPAITAMGTTETEHVQVGALGLLAGVRPSMQMLPLAKKLKLFAKVAANTEVHDDDAAPWRYRREPLARLAEQTRLQHPGQVLDPRRRALAERHLQALHAAAAEADRRDDDSVDSDW